MKFIIVGPGYMSIPPKGWGAVESLIHDYRINLERLGHEVHVINTKILQQAISLINALNPDIVHVQLDDYAKIIPHINCANILVTSHYAYLEQPEKWDPGYHDNFWSFVNCKASVFCLSAGIKDVYIRGGILEERLRIVPNGVRDDLFNFSAEAKYKDRTMYLAKVDFRKSQYKFQHIPSLYFAGNLADDRFDATSARYLGEWSKEYLYEHLTDYANLALLSDGEAHSLVCLEALSAGLGLVISEPAAANLDLSLPFIDVIPNSKLEDTEYISRVLQQNREISLSMREDIRAYVIENFSWENIIKNHYIPAVKSVVK